MKTGPKAAIILGAVVVLAILAVSGLRAAFARHDGIHYVTRAVGFADISATVSETGTVNPVNTVLVGSQVSGTIVSLGADYNSRVKANQVLATLDPTDYEAAVDSAKANLALAEASLNSAKVNVGKMKALLDMDNLTVQRDEPLLKQGLINQNQMDEDNTAAVAGNQDYLAAQAAEQVAEAQVAVNKGQLEQAEYNLAQTVIRTPWDGIIMARNVSIGQTVASSLQTPTLFTLATNLTDMQVDTSVDEADVGGVREGASANFTVTAFPNQTFAGTVQQVRINPIVTANVVTYDAVVSVHDTSGRLLPGMTAQVSIDVGKRTHVPAVPISALLYRPLALSNPAVSPAGAFGGGAGVVQSSGAAPAGEAVAGAPGSQVTVWVLMEGRPVPRRVVIGLSDGKNVEITGGDLHPGDQLIIAQRRGRGAGAKQGGEDKGAPRRGATGTAPAAGSSGGSGGSSPSVGGGEPAGSPPRAQHNPWTVAAHHDRRHRGRSMTEAAAAAETPLIEVEIVTKIYGEGASSVHALRGASLSITRREFVAIMGPSGSGKSTFMHLLGCLDRPTSGSYRLGGEEVSDFTPDQLAAVRSRQIGFVFQTFNLTARTTALENGEPPLLYAGVPQKARVGRSRTLLEQVGHGERLDHRPNKLSGGQQQRVAIARSLANGAPLLMADLFRKLNRDSGITVIVVTHAVDAAAWTDRIVTLRDWLVVDDRPSREVLSGSAQYAGASDHYRPEASG